MAASAPMSKSKIITHISEEVEVSKKQAAAMLDALIDLAHKEAKKGFTLPGAPLVVIGHNDRIAWGVTNNGADVLDLYIETFNPASSDEYRAKAEYCRQMADQVPSPLDKEMWLQLAWDWSTLASVRERYGTQYRAPQLPGPLIPL